MLPWLSRAVKERVVRLGHKAAGIIVATSLFSGGGGPAPVTPHHELSVPSCQHFLNSYTPQMDTSLLDGADALLYKESLLAFVYPNPSYARETLAPVVSVLKKESAAGRLPLRELEDAYNSLPKEESVQHMQDTHVDNRTFSRQRREMLLAQSQLHQTVAACEQVVPVSQRRDGWYVQDQTDKAAALFWEKYGLPVFFVLGFMSLGALEKLFIGEKNS